MKTPETTRRAAQPPTVVAHAKGWNLGDLLKIAIAGLVVIWLISLFGDSPLDQVFEAVGIEQDGGTTIDDYNDQQQWDEIMDPIIGCPPGVDCHGLPDPDGL
jgi:hypothetical protein